MTGTGHSVWKLASGVALLSLVVGGPSAAQAPRRVGAGGRGHPMMALNGMATKGSAFHLLTLRVFGVSGRPSTTALTTGKRSAVLLFGTTLYGVALEGAGKGRLKGTVVAIPRPTRGRGGRPGKAGPGLAELIKQGKRVGTLSLQVKFYEGRLLATGKAELASGSYRGSWKVILFTRPMLGQPGGAGKAKAGSKGGKRK